MKQSPSVIHLIFEAAPNGMIMVDQTGKIILSNLQFEKMFGYSKEELLKSSIDRLVPERFRANHPQYRKGFFHEPQVRPMGAGRDLFGKRKDGSEFPVEIGLSPIKINNELFVIGSVVDITERKQTEEKIKKANEELKRLNQLKTEFTSMVSHELRTPLSSIKGGIDIVLDGLDGPINPEQAETLGIAKSNVDRLARMIDNVLDYTRHEYGKLKMVFAETDLNKLVIEVHKLMVPAVLKKSIDFSINLPETTNRIRCDADRIKEVLINLVDNAIKHTPARGRISIRLHCDGSSAILEVEDNGSGINPQDHEKIFALFSQGSIGKAGGSGVGLAVCKLIAEAHHGTISVQSELGKGTKFTLKWPIR